MKKTLIICLTVLVLAIGVGLFAWHSLAIKNETAYQEKLEQTLEQIEASTTNAAALASTYKTYWGATIDRMIPFSTLSDGLDIPYSTLENIVSDSDKYGVSGNYWLKKGEINAMRTLVEKGKADEINLILVEHASISDAISELKNPPEKFKEAYAALLEVFELYDSFSSISTFPVGSYIEYGKTINATYEELSSKIKTAQLQL